MLFFFFKQKTAYEMRISDWSSDVCSSDLAAARWRSLGHARRRHVDQRPDVRLAEHRPRQSVRLVLAARLRRPGEGGPALSGRVLLPRLRPEIGRASCRERVCQYV